MSDNKRIGFKIESLHKDNDSVIIAECEWIFRLTGVNRFGNYNYEGTE